MNHYFFFKLHFSLTLYMTGVIWLIQIIHYPLFKFVGESTFLDYHKGHLQKTSLVIAMPMLLELLTAIYLIAAHSIYRSNIAFLVASFFIAFIWIITFFISVPKHDLLSSDHNDLTITALVKTNWIRTIAWSIRAIILFFIL